MHHSFNNYLHLLTSLRRGPTAYGLAPHKPVLLLSLIDLIEQLQLVENRIPIGPELFFLFRSNWKKLVHTKNVSDITLPLFHLSDGLGWLMAGKDGHAIHRKLSSQQQIIGLVDYGRFESSFFQFLQTAENRMLARMVLLDTYFSDTRMNYLKDRPYPAFVLDIEQSILEEPQPRYRQYTREVEGFVRDWKFPQLVMEAYRHTCCMSGLHLEPGFSIVEACHIVRHADTGIDHITNGLALCVNLHRAFDHGLLSLNDHFEILVKPKVRESDSPYNVHQLKGRRILLPQNERFYPGLQYLKLHRKEHGF